MAKFLQPCGDARPIFHGRCLSIHRAHTLRTLSLQAKCEHHTTHLLHFPYACSTLRGSALQVPRRLRIHAAVRSSIFLRLVVLAPNPHMQSTLNFRLVGRSGVLAPTVVQHVGDLFPTTSTSIEPPLTKLYQNLKTFLVILKEGGRGLGGFELS